MPSDTIVQFDFSKALAHLRQGKRVRRLPWYERHWIKLFQDFPYIRISTDNTLPPWASPHKDILATDWVLVEEELKSETPANGRAIGSGDALPGEVD